MERKSESMRVFAGAVVLAYALYTLTLPTGLPWADGATLPGAWIWAALAAGVLGAVVARYFGWRVGAAAALVWTFLPPVWDRAILGSRSMAFVSIAICGGWALDAVIRAIVRKMIAARNANDPLRSGSTLTEAAPNGTGGRMRVLVGRILLTAAGALALISLTSHDYRLGEAASAFAQGVVDEAGERIVVLNGVLDEQVVVEVKKRGGGGQGREDSDSAGQLNKATDIHCPPPPAFSTLSLRSDEACRTNLLAWVRREWPSETNLHLAVQVSVAAFLDAAVKAHPDRFYVMSGASSTAAGWERRWTAFAPYLKSSDPFVPVARRLFGYEANAVANGLADDKAAYALYRRIYGNIDPGNISALVNMSEMIRRGFVTGADERKKVEEDLAVFFKDEFNRRHVREIVQIAGPIRADPEMAAKAAASAEAAGERILERLGSGEKVMLPAEVKLMFEQSDTMVRLMMSGDRATAAKIARHILSQPAWRMWVPANAVMGEALAAEGDYVGAEAFFRTAMVDCDRMPGLVVNNYADVLLRLGKLDEAERVLRNLIARGDDALYAAHLTLAEVLTKKVKGGDQGQGRVENEVRELTTAVRRNAPEELKRMLREKLRSGDVLK